MNNLETLTNILLSDNVVDDFYKNYNGEFKKWLLQILPEIEDCKNQQQINPWHKYNVLDHILHSVEEMNKQTKNFTKDRLLLAITMFLHDIGKPECHVSRIVEGKQRDSFFNHNIASEKIARRILPLFNFNKEEIEIISKLVFKHDIFMFIKPFKTDNPHWKTLSPKLIIDEITDLNSVGDGKKLLKYLIMIGRSDNLAQNEKMTPPSLRMLDKMDKMLNKI